MAQPLPVPARAILPLPEPIHIEPVTVYLEAGNDGQPRVVYTAREHETMLSNVGDIYRWVAEAMAQLEFYRKAD